MNDIQWRVSLCSLFVLSGLVGCADESATQTTEVATYSNGTVNKTSTPGIPLNEAVAALSTEKIAFEAFTQQLPIIMTETEPCPFISDEKAINAAKSTRFNLVRQSVSNERCVWSKNLGFSVSIDIRPIELGLVQNPSYNMDTPPVIKTQSGPGNNARVLYDTAWDEERPYAMVFDQNDQSVLISITGMSTDEQRLRIAADEVADRMNDMPIIEAQQRSGEWAYRLCETWSIDEVLPVLGVSEFQSSEAIAYTADACTYSVYLLGGYSSEYKLEAKLFTYVSSDNAFDQMRKNGAQELSEFDTLTMIENLTGELAATRITTERDGYTITLSVTSNAPYGREANIALMQNLLTRLE